MGPWVAGTGAAGVRVLVCGAAYGSTYLRAQFVEPGRFSVVGVLGRGGASSTHVAAQFGVPCYHDPAQVPIDGVDVVCVAVGGRAGVQLAELFLGLGRPVLQEHPVGPEDMLRLDTVAAQAGVPYHVNAHFGDLPTVAPLVVGAQRLGPSGPPTTVDLTVNQRTLFSALDIVARALGGLGEPCWRGPTDDPPGPPPFFDVLTGTLAGVPAVLQCQRTVSRIDDGSGAAVSHHIRLGYPSGTLELADTTGPVIWRAGAASVAVDAPMWVDATSVPPPTPARFQQQRDRSVADQVAALVGHARTGRCPGNQTPAFRHDVTRVWRLTSDALGPPTVV